MRTGRPVTVNIAKSEHIGINVSSDTAKKIEKLRGLVSRSAYIRDILDKHVTQTAIIK